MRLLHITATHLNPTGGIPVVLRDLVNAQNRIEGFEARVLSINADVADVSSEYFDYLGKESFISYIGDYYPDVVIFHSHYYLEYIHIAKILREKGISYYIEPHGSFGRSALNKSKFKKFIANNTFFRAFLRNAYGYIFLNQAENTDAIITTENDLTISNGVDGDTIGFDICPQKPWCFYYIGRYDINHKGLDYLLDALEILDKHGTSIDVKFYGAGTRKEVEYLNNRLKELNSVNAVNCGPIYGDEKTAVLEQCGIMILTSRYEGQPMTVLEGWTYGNPCLLTPGTNMAYESVNNNLGWITELDSETIANTLIRASKEYKEKRIEYIKNCKSYAYRNYAWDAIAQKSYDLILEALSIEKRNNLELTSTNKG